MHADEQQPHHGPGDHGHHDHGRASPVGALIRWPRRYDLIAAIAFAGRGRRFRAQLARQLDLRPGRRVLDVGCGTGTLTLALARVVGPNGSADGVDAAAEMVATAARKARRARRGRPPARFQVAAAQRLPFPDGSMDAAVTSLMIHHLPPADRGTAVGELIRVLRPGGRLAIADAQPPASGGRLVRRLFRHAIENSDLDATADLAAAAGAVDLRRDATPLPWLGVVLARKPAAAAAVPSGEGDGEDQPRSGTDD